jgi:hypothetical protein
MSNGPSTTNANIGRPHWQPQPTRTNNYPANTANNINHNYHSSSGFNSRSYNNQPGDNRNPSVRPSGSGNAAPPSFNNSSSSHSYNHRTNNPIHNNTGNRAVNSVQPINTSAVQQCKPASSDPSVSKPTKVRKRVPRPEARAAREALERSAV